MTGEAPIRVIVVDDHEMFAESIGRVLALEDDIEVAGLAASSRQGIELAEALAPDVAIVDHRLPDAGGAQTIRRILAVSPSTKVLILSGYKDHQIVSSSIRAGCSGFLSKDKAVRELAVAVRAVRDGEAYLPSEALGRLVARGSTPDGAGPGDELTRRERHVLQLMAGGLSNRAIATQLSLSLNTVRNHVQRILTKMEAHSKLEAVMIAFREDLVERPE